MRLNNNYKCNNKRITLIYNKIIDKTNFELHFFSSGYTCYLLLKLLKLLLELQMQLKVSFVDDFVILLNIQNQSILGIN